MSATEPVDNLEPAINALLSVGHSSGSGLLHGVRIGLKALTTVLTQKGLAA